MLSLVNPVPETVTDIEEEPAGTALGEIELMVRAEFEEELPAMLTFPLQPASGKRANASKMLDDSAGEGRKAL